MKCRPEVVGWGFTESDLFTRWSSSNISRGGASAADRQQVLAVPVLSNNQVKYIRT
jgi:hypothetical protein